MKRREMLGIAGTISAYTLTCQAEIGIAQELSPPEKDPWVGAYLKYGQYDTGRTGQFGEAQTIRVTKDRDGYSLSAPYSHAHFKERSKGVLSDGDGGLGKIYLGSLEYPDGTKATILRADFCYEDFILYRETVKATAKTPVQPDK